MAESYETLRRILLSGSWSSFCKAGTLTGEEYPMMNNIELRNKILAACEVEGGQKQAVTLIKSLCRKEAPNISLPCPSLGVFVAAVCSLSSDHKLREAIYAELHSLLHTGHDWLLFHRFRTAILAKSQGDSSKHFGAGMKRAFTRWLRSFPTSVDLALAITETGTMNCRTWTIKDILKMHHIKPANEEMDVIFRCILGKLDVQARSTPENTWPVLEWFKLLKLLRACPRDGEGPAQARSYLERDSRLGIQHLPYHLMTSRDPWEELMTRAPLSQVFCYVSRLFWADLLHPGSTLAQLFMERLMHPTMSDGVDPLIAFFFLKEIENPEAANKVYVAEILHGGKRQKPDLKPLAVHFLPKLNPALAQALKTFINKSCDYTSHPVIPLPVSPLELPRMRKVLVVLDARAIVAEENQRCFYSPMVTSLEAICLFAYILNQRYNATLKRAFVERNMVVLKDMEVPEGLELKRENIWDFTQRFRNQLQPKPEKIAVRKLSPAGVVNVAPTGSEIIVILGSSNFTYGQRDALTNALTEYQTKPGSKAGVKAAVCCFYNKKFRVANDDDKKILELAGLDKFSLRLLLAFVENTF